MTKQNGVDVWPNAAIWMRDELRLRLRTAPMSISLSPCPCLCRYLVCMCQSYVPLLWVSLPTAEDAVVRVILIVSDLIQRLTPKLKLK